jgi:hypothetical protein
MTMRRLISIFVALAQFSRQFSGEAQVQPTQVPQSI